MPNTKYSRGVYYERVVMEKLDGQGYTTHRMAGSHGAFDVIAYNGLICRLIQVKSTQKKVVHNLYRPDLFKIMLVDAPYNFVRELWIYGIVNGKKGVVKICVL